DIIVATVGCRFAEEEPRTKRSTCSARGSFARFSVSKHRVEDKTLLHRLRGSINTARAVGAARATRAARSLDPLATRRLAAASPLATRRFRCLVRRTAVATRPVRAADAVGAT